MKKKHLGKRRGIAADIRPLNERRFPDFMCIGVQKAGTTWLHKNLRNHPDVWLPPVKELQYFNDLYIPRSRRWASNFRRRRWIQVLQHYLDKIPEEKRNYRHVARIADIIDSEISDDWYGRIFSLAKPDQICGEVSPDYSQLPIEGINHVFRLMPNVKIILSLRDPIERNWSHVRMVMRAKSATNLSKLEKAVLNPDIVQRADYRTIIANWTSIVPVEQLLVVFMDDIISDPIRTLERICVFLEIKFDEEYFSRADVPVHVGEVKPIPPPIYALLKHQLRPTYDEICALYPQIGEAWLSRHY